MLRTIIGSFVFFLIATAVTIQPACEGLGEEPFYKVQIKIR